MTNNTQELKQQLREKLSADGIPDLAFFYSEEVLDIAEEFLGELLEENKQDFEKKLATKNEEITFGLLDSEDILDYFWNYLEHLKGVYSGEKIRNIIENFEPKLIEFGNYIAYNKRYYEMLLICLENCELDSDQKRIVSEGIKSYKIRGINLDSDKQKRLKEISQELSKLSTSFSNNVLDSENEFSYTVTDFECIKNLPKEVLDRVKKEDAYIFTANPADYINIMKYCDNRDIRKDFHIAQRTFASEGQYDNRQNIIDILSLKQEKSQILGCKNYVELSLEFKMAGSPNEVIGLLEDVSSRAKKKAVEEMDFLKQYFSLETIADYDVGYYYRRLKEEKYALDDKELKKYFEFEAVLSGLHKIVGDIFGLELKEISFPHGGKVLKGGEKLKGENAEDNWLEDVRLYEVYNNGEHIAYYLLDAFYREEKRSGAWANNLRPKFGYKLPFVINVCNFSKEKEASLLSLGEVQTLFHEFGHATHEMLGKSKYSDLSGFGVEWDFIEVPSQFLEHWADERESLTTFAKHYKTGKVIPEHFLDTLDVLDTIGNGLGVLKQNEYALLDMCLYSNEVSETAEQLDMQVKEITEKYSLFPNEEGTKMYTSFQHIFAGGYAAGYYSYMWAEIIELDLLRECKKGGMFNTEFLEQYRKKILEAGSRGDAKDLVKDLLGREVDIKGFFEKKGI